MVTHLQDRAFVRLLQKRLQDCPRLLLFVGGGREIRNAGYYGSDALCLLGLGDCCNVDEAIAVASCCAFVDYSADFSCVAVDLWLLFFFSRRTSDLPWDAFSLTR